MFTVLDVVSPPRRGIIKAAFHKAAVGLRGADIYINQATAGNVKYFIIRTELSKGKVDWNKVYRATGREAYHLIIPEGIRPPAGGPVTPYDTTEYLRRVFCNTVFRLMKKWPVPAKDNVIGLYDPAAKSGETACRLIKYAGVVKVLTNNAEKYRLYSDRAMEKYGAGIIVSDRQETLENCDIIIAPHGMSGCEYYPCHALVLDFDGVCGYTVTKECIKIPEIYKRNVPKGVSDAVLAAALYEKARVKEMGALVPRFLMINGKKISIYDIADNLPHTVKSV